MAPSLFSSSSSTTAASPSPSSSSSSLSSSSGYGCSSGSSSGSSSSSSCASVSPSPTSSLSQLTTMSAISSTEMPFINNANDDDIGVGGGVNVVAPPSQQNSTIAPPFQLYDFYRHRSVFITGGTGFVGKVLIEKLLYTFRDIGHIYVLLRPKAGQLIRKRLQELINSPAFDRVRRECPEQFAKLIPIGGDISFPGLGINPLELHTVTTNVSVVFHSAATIRFDEPLKYALKINTLGTKRVIELAKKLKELAAFVHVSTAYCSVQKHGIEERVYREPISPDRVLEMANWMDDESFNQLKDMFYQGRPCSYHYTKSLAEHLIAQECEQGYFYAYHGGGCSGAVDSAAVSKVAANAISNAASTTSAITTTKNNNKMLNSEESESESEDEGCHNDENVDLDEDELPNIQVPGPEIPPPLTKNMPMMMKTKTKTKTKNKKNSKNQEHSSLYDELLLQQESSGDGSGKNNPTTATSAWRPFPAAIIRPSIITCAWREPFPGWVDNYNGTTGFMVANGKGILRTMHAKPEYVTDMIPVDVVINCCVTAAWHVAVQRRPKYPAAWMQHQHQQQKLKQHDRRHSDGSSSSGISSSSEFNGSSGSGSGGSSFLSAAVTGSVIGNTSSTSTSTSRNPAMEPFVVNCVSGSSNPLTWSQLRELTTPILMKYPSTELFRVPGVRYHRHQRAHQLNVLLEHTIPAVVVDFVFRFLGHSPIMDQVYQKVHRTIRALEHFTTNEWTYVGDNMIRLDRAARRSFVKRRQQQQQQQQQQKRKQCETSSQRLDDDDDDDDADADAVDAAGGNLTVVEKEKNPAFFYYQVNGLHLSENSSSSKKSKSIAQFKQHRSSSIKSTCLHPFVQDMSTLNWREYFEDYVLGIRLYLLKEKPETISEARQTLFLLRMLTLLSKLTVGGTIAYQVLYPRSITRQYTPQSVQKMIGNILRPLRAIISNISPPSSSSSLSLTSPTSASLTATSALWH